MSNFYLGDYAGARYDYNRARSQEKTANNIVTGLGLGATGVLAYSANTLAKANPKKAVKVYQGVDKYVDIGLEKGYEYSNKFVKFISKNKYGKKIVDKLSGWFMKGAKKVGKTESGKKFITKALEKFEKFSNLSSAKRGKYMLLTAGIAALASTAIHLIRQHDRNDGAIDQKYNDIDKLSRVL